MNDMSECTEKTKPSLQQQEMLGAARDEIIKFLSAAGLNWPEHQIDKKAILSAQAWNEIPVDALPAACLEARRTTERGVPMDSEVIRAHRRLTNSKPLPGPVRYQSGQVDMNYHERLAAHAAKCRREVHRTCKEGDRMTKEEHTAAIRITMGMVSGKVPIEWGRESVELLADRRVTAAELMAELASVA